MSENKTKTPEANKPLEERNYFKLPKGDKKTWCALRKCDQSEDIRRPIAISLVGVIAGFLVGLVILIMHIVAAKNATPEHSGILASKIWIAGAVICMCCGLGVTIWQLVVMKKDGKGFWINNYYSGDKNSVALQREEIEHDKESEDRFGHDSGASLEDLEL